MHNDPKRRHFGRLWARRRQVWMCSALTTLLTVLPCAVRAQLAPRPPAAMDAPVPIVFVHGNGDHAGLWDATIWRFESNGYPRDRLFAIDLPNPMATASTTTREPNRSTPEDQAAALAAEVTRVLLRTGASKVALVGSSRGGITMRHYVRFGGGAAHVSHVITAGTPNHGVFALDGFSAGSEFNGRSTFLRALNAEREVEPGIAYLTLRSDSLDKYAQPFGAALGAPTMATGVDALSPTLAGAQNVVLPGTDHREVAFGSAAFKAKYTFLTGRDPLTTAITAESSVVLDGMVSANAFGAPTNTPLSGALVTVHEVDATTGERVRTALHTQRTRDDGRWGPFRASATSRYEFEVVAPDSSVILHVYRAPFPRSSRVVNFRLPAPPSDTTRGDSVSVLLVRPRGYLGAGRDRVLFDDTPARGIPDGVPTTDRVSWRGPADRPRSVRARFNDDVIVVRTQPNDRRRLVVAELPNE
jgi:triacylglycerol lipase